MSDLEGSLRHFKRQEKEKRTTQHHRRLYLFLDERREGAFCLFGQIIISFTKGGGGFERCQKFYLVSPFFLSFFFVSRMLLCHTSPAGEIALWGLGVCMQHTPDTGGLKYFSFKNDVFSSHYMHSPTRSQYKNSLKINTFWEGNHPVLSAMPRVECLLSFILLDRFSSIHIRKRSVCFGWMER